MNNKFLIIPFLILIQWAQAQTGDVELPAVQQRAYLKAVADSALKGNGLKKFLIGKNYRSEWTEPTRVPVLNFKTDFGGLTPEKEGGGKQTHTLHLKDSNGRGWSLRSVEKFPEKVLAPEMKGTVAESLVSDGISASYPFGVLSVGTLAKAAGVPYLPNTVVYIPDDPALGEFRSKYKNTLALLELKSPWDSAIKSYDTYEMVPELLKTNKKTVDQQAALKARLLDNFIMDFDRHEGQWVWLEKDSAGKKFFYPVPKDRDQAFFKGDGLIIKKLSHIPSLGQLQGLRAKPKNVLTFNYAASNFDRSFLNELDENTWSNAVDTFLSSVTNDVIENAMVKQPKEIQSYHATEIAGILEKKRTTFRNDMMRYYRFLSKTVSVVGSNDAEIFTVTKNTDGTVKLTVQNLKDSAVTYQRLFDPSITKEIRVYGLEGDDRFVILGEKSPIKIRLIGGPGEDVYSGEAGGKKVLVYDVSSENNTLTGDGLKNKISRDPLNNEYRRINPEYNSSSVGFTPEYAREGDLFLGLHYTATTTGFRKEPYASRHHVYVTKAVSSSAWHAHYDADFISIAKKTDLLFKSDAQLPTVRTNFFGYGNNSVFDKRVSAEYYKVHYTLVDASLMARHTIAPWFQLSWGPFLQYFKIQPEKNEDHYISSLPPTPGIYDATWYTGGEVRATVNTKNSELIPTRGIYFNTYAKGFAGISEHTSNFSEVGSDFSFYTDFLFKKHIILASDFGAHRNFGSFQVPQAQYLGFKQNLRGFRYQRFAGDARAYNNTEIRVNFGDVNLYLFKGPIGITAFHDIGRVWVSGEDSDTWHRGYGGGIWLAPFNKFVLNGTLSFSKEERAYPLLIFGFQF